MFMNFEEKEKKKDGIIEKKDGIIEKNDDLIEKKIFKWLFIVMWLVLLGAIGLVVMFLFRYYSSNNSNVATVNILSIISPFADYIVRAFGFMLLIMGVRTYCKSVVSGNSFGSICWRRIIIAVFIGSTLMVGGINLLSMAVLN